MRAVVEPLTALSVDATQSWEELAARVSAPNPFSEPSMAAPAARGLADGDRAALLRVVSNGRTVLAVPVVRERRFRRFPLGTLATWRHAHCCAGEPVVDPGDAHEAWGAVLDYVVDERIPWLVLQLVYPDSAPIAALEEVLAARGLRSHAFDAYERAVVRKQGQAIAPDEGLSARHRSDLRRKRRGLAKALGLEPDPTDVLADADRVDDAVDAFLALEASGWKGREGTAMACRTADADFFNINHSKWSNDGENNGASACVGAVFKRSRLDRDFGANVHV